MSAALNRLWSTRIGTECRSDGQPRATAVCAAFGSQGSQRMSLRKCRLRSRLRAELTLARLIWALGLTGDIQHGADAVGCMKLGDPVVDGVQGQAMADHSF